MSSSREERLGYERRILAAEVETVRIAKRASRFAELIQRNTETLDAALAVANFDADKRGYDRLVVEPWMPTLLSLLDDIHELIGDDNPAVTIGTELGRLLDEAAAQDHERTADDLETLRNRLGKDALSMDEWNALVGAACYLRMEASRRLRTRTASSGEDV